MKMNTRMTVPAGMPSPLVGEGSTAASPDYTWVRGSLHDHVVSREPLTRRRFATPPSPTRGEGKNSATQASRKT
jgi:hypothetical protein